MTHKTMMHQLSKWKILSVLTAMCFVAVDAGGRGGAKAGPTDSDSHDVSYIGVPFYQVVIVVVVAIVICMVICGLFAGWTMVSRKKAYNRGQQSMINHDIELGNTRRLSVDYPTVRREEPRDSEKQIQAQVCAVEYFRPKEPKVKKARKSHFRKKREQDVKTDSGQHLPELPDLKAAEADIPEALTALGSSLDQEAPIVAD